MNSSVTVLGKHVNHVQWGEWGRFHNGTMRCPSSCLDYGKGGGVTCWVLVKGLNVSHLPGKVFVGRFQNPLPEERTEPYSRRNWSSGPDTVLPELELGWRCDEVGRYGSALLQVSPDRQSFLLSTTLGARSTVLTCKYTQVKLRDGFDFSLE